jgi:hypothetical protein
LSVKRIGARTSERWKSGAIVQVDHYRSDQSDITLSPDSRITRSMSR